MNEHTKICTKTEIVVVQVTPTSNKARKSTTCASLSPSYWLNE